MAFIILSPTFSLFATNILKLYSVIYAPARLHGMPFLLLNQFLACSAGARIFSGKHSLAFILMQLGGVLISRTSVYCCAFSHWDCILCISTIVIIVEDVPSPLLLLTDKELCILQFHISTKKNKSKLQHNSQDKFRGAFITQMET